MTFESLMHRMVGAGLLWVSILMSWGAYLFMGWMWISWSYFGLSPFMVCLFFTPGAVLVGSCATLVLVSVSMVIHPD